MSNGFDGWMDGWSIGLKIWYLQLDGEVPYERVLHEDLYLDDTQW